MPRWIKNADVGKCLCPFKGCTEEVPVFKFRQRTQDPGRRRMGGKLYGECPTHGRFIDQEWLLKELKWHAKNRSDEAQASAVVVLPASPVKAPEKTAPSPVTGAPVRERKSPVTSPAKGPATEPEKSTKEESGFFL